jgi:hypothetical protein
MTKLADVMKQNNAELTKLLKQIKDSDEDDFGELARLYDQVSERADQMANRLSNADKAFSDEQDADKQDEDDDAESEEQSAAA